MPQKANPKMDPVQRPLAKELPQLKDDSNIIPFPIHTEHPSSRPVTVHRITTSTTPLVITEVSSGFGSSTPQAMLAA
ncbi:hypothetical protein [Marininema halotolerans]|uniref:Uncharacterized protein n=1 Tax=Marininema halotolerans TaxID=1155944 RepID=A0A1I6U793_9BACL|nr:hypothetical protein [Marininema halotolerans]SFS97326.1 hypothetical protein SAMN05444972_11424 [Marininema halotolerans]